jgi:hypothetical protein
MDSKGPDKQADRPVRPSGPMRGPSTACEWCSGPADGVLDFMHLNDRGRRLRVCMACQQRHIASKHSTPESAPSPSSSPVPVPLPERANPGVGGVETGVPAKRGRR